MQEVECSIMPSLIPHLGQIDKREKLSINKDTWNDGSIVIRLW